MVAARATVGSTVIEEEISLTQQSQEILSLDIARRETYLRYRETKGMLWLALLAFLFGALFAAGTFEYFWDRIWAAHWHRVALDTIIWFRFLIVLSGMLSAAIVSLVYRAILKKERQSLEIDIQTSRAQIAMDLEKETKKRIVKARQSGAFDRFE